MSPLALRRLLAGLAVAALLPVLAACAGVPAPTAAGPDAEPVPALVTSWANAWNADRPNDLAALFAPDAVYEDHAFQATWRGPDEIASWVTRTHQAVEGVDVRVEEAFRSGDRIAVTWTFSGRIRGAPQPFSVPATTVLELRDDRIVHNEDYYNLAAVLKQSGVPAEWPPPAG